LLIFWIADAPGLYYLPKYGKGSMRNSKKNRQILTDLTEIKKYIFFTGINADIKP
jgi:hypothetical protein